MLRLCLWLISWFLVFSCTTLRHEKETSDSRDGYQADIKLVTNEHDGRWISVLTEMGFNPVLINSNFDETNAAPDILTIRIHLYDRQQLRVFQANAAAAGVLIADIKIERE